MFYKRKQICWIDRYISGNRIKMCTGFKDKVRAQKLFFDLIEMENDDWEEETCSDEDGD